jgi:type IV pilus modification protein PilV
VQFDADRRAGADRLRQLGSTVVETLAALLVIGVAAVGVAAIHLDAARAHPEQRLHEQAARLAEKIAERMRKNAEGRVGYAHTIGVLCHSKRQPRSPQELASMEAACWQDEIERALPSGAGSITRDVTTTPVTYIVAVSWSAPTGGAASYVVRVD